VYQVPQDHQDLLEVEDHQDLMERQEQMDSVEHQGLKGPLELLVQLAIRVSLEILGQQERLVLKVT
jgi:hypothetical protein